jgi:FkbM family methyltransferase
VAAGLLHWLERGGSALRRLGLGSVVDRAGPVVGAIAARRPVSVNGLRLAGGHVGQLYYLRELERGRDRFLGELLRTATPPGSVAVDVGAHIGYLTLELARAVGPAGRVYAMEPDPAVAATLRSNLRRNGLAARVVVVERAAGATSGRASLYVSGGGETSSLAAVPGFRRELDVAVTPVDDVIGDDPVDVVKLDVEGAEVAALQGMKRLLRRRGDLTLVVECNPALLAAMGTSAGALLALLGEEGFSVWQVDEAGTRLSPSIDLGPNEYVNLCCGRGRSQQVLADYASSSR